MKSKCDENIENKVIAITKKLILRYGVKGWSMDDLASECSMSKKTFYKIIGNKEELIYRCVLQTREENLKKIEKFVNSYQSYNERLENFDNVFPQIFAPYIIKNDVQLKSYSPRVREVIDKMNKSHELLFMNFFEKGKTLGCLVDFVESKLVYDLLRGIIELNFLKYKNAKELNRKNNLALKIMINGMSK